MLLRVTWSTALAVVPAITAGVAVTVAIGNWWRARTWSSLDDARKMLDELSTTKNSLIGEAISEGAAGASTALLLELGTRAQLRAKRVAKRNSGSRFFWTTAGISAVALGMGAVGIWGFVATMLGEQVVDAPTWSAYVYFGLFGVGCSLICVLFVRERIGIWRRTANLREFFRAISRQDAFLQMHDRPDPSDRTTQQPT
jgi:phosphotransferase system  glucose/maltose/N-acetylglucosamine-specific IIC component